MGSDSWAELFDRHGAAVFRRCLQILCNDDAACDAVQEVFLRALSKRNSFRHASSPLTWLYAIATTYCLQQLRNTSRREAKSAHWLLPTGTNSLGMDEKWSLIEVLRRFDDEIQLIACLRFIDELSLEEVAEVSGLSRKTVVKRLDHFAKQARREFEPAQAISGVER